MIEPLPKLRIHLRRIDGKLTLIGKRKALELLCREGSKPQPKGDKYVLLRKTSG
jgi:hypothetical protein